MVISGVDEVVVVGEARAQYRVRVGLVRTPRRGRVGYVVCEVPCRVLCVCECCVVSAECVSAVRHGVLLTLCTPRLL